MGYALMTYVVDLDTLHSSVGSKDDKLRRMIGGAGHATVPQRLE